MKMVPGPLVPSTAARTEAYVQEAGGRQTSHCIQVGPSTQTCVAAGQKPLPHVTPQLPPWQICPVPQALPQVPQLARSVAVSTQRPPQQSLPLPVAVHSPALEQAVHAWLGEQIGAATVEH